MGWTPYVCFKRKEHVMVFNTFYVLEIKHFGIEPLILHADEPYGSHEERMTRSFGKILGFVGS